MRQTIYVVEDDDDIALLISHHLAKNGYEVVRYADGASALDAIKQKKPDLVLLDLMLPGMDGLELLKQIRYQLSSRVPVIIESARGEDSDVVTGLTIGADDYIPKPFAPTVLVAKVKSLLRRVKNDQEEEEETAQCGDLILNKSKWSCIAGGSPVSLTATEFQILFTLVSHPERVFTRGQLIQATKGSDYPVTERSIDVQIATIRRKIGPEGKHLKTVWGVGYTYQQDETAAQQ